MTEIIRKTERVRGFARCECGEEFKGRSQRKAEAKWRKHYLEVHQVEPVEEPEPEEDR